MELSQHFNSLGYVNLGRIAMMQQLRPYFLPDEMDQIEAAYPISKYGHSSDIRDDSTRYFEHPKTVAWLIFERYALYDWETIVMALLHDIIEDSYILNVRRIRLNWGDLVARGVYVLSKNTFDKALLADSDRPYYNRILTQGSWQCQAVKIVDRIHNLSTSSGLDADRRERKMYETWEHFPGILDQLEATIPDPFTSGVVQMRLDLNSLSNEWSDEFGRERSSVFDKT